MNFMTILSFKIVRNPRIFLRKLAIFICDFRVLEKGILYRPRRIIDQSLNLIWLKKQPITLFSTDY